jgi:hypothetical protein
VKKDRYGRIGLGIGLIKGGEDELENLCMLQITLSMGGYQ